MSNSCATPGSSVHEISQARRLEWVDIFFSRGSSWPRDQTLHPLHWLADSLLLGHQFISVAQFCPTSCNPMDHNTSGLLSITNSQSWLKLMSIEWWCHSTNHLILSCPLLLLPSIFPSIRVFSNESVLHIMLPKYWSFSFSISPSNEYSGLICFRMDLLGLLAV